MWIVEVALQRPYTFITLAVLILLLGSYAIVVTATDIFPNIRIPVAAVIWRYNGVLPEEMANRIVLFSERVAQTTVNDVEHAESQSVNSVAVVKYFFQPSVDTASNQDLKAAFARWQEARATTRVARSGLFPTLNAAASAARGRVSQNTAGYLPGAEATFNDFDVQADLSYEIDLWGRVRNTVTAAKANQQASAADLASVELAVRAELAALQAQLTQMSILNRRMSACVLLIRALGGGWSLTRAEGSLVRSDESPSLQGPTG